MPLLGGTSRQVLPPIKNPVFSLTEKSTVTVSEQEEASSKSQDSVSADNVDLFMFSIYQYSSLILLKFLQF